LLFGPIRTPVGIEEVSYDKEECRITLTVIVMIIGAIVFALATRKLAVDAKYGNLSYYGYGIVMGACCPLGCLWSVISCPSRI
jgi:hypothetical protein